MRFKRTGYKEIAPLETNIVTTSMLGSIPVNFIAMEANDSKFVAMIFNALFEHLTMLFIAESSLKRVLITFPKKLYLNKFLVLVSAI